jgi:hypothetical protein
VPCQKPFVPGNVVVPGQCHHDSRGRSRQGRTKVPMITDEGQTTRNRLPPAGDGGRETVLGADAMVQVVSPGQLELTGTGVRAIPGSISDSGLVRRRCRNPRTDRISIRPAAMKAAIEASSAISPSCQNP